MKKDLPSILLIEDSEADVELMKFLFADCGTPLNLHIARDGIEGSDFIFKQGKFSDSPGVDLILLDLNLPKRDGRELLKQIKQDAHLCKIPVVMLSTSTSYREISEVYCLGASAFISKSPDLDCFQQTINSLVDFWLKRICLPTRLEPAI